MIGFLKEKYQKEENTTASLGCSGPIAEQVLRNRAAALIFEAVKDYVSPTAYPAIKGEERDRWLEEKISKIRKRYLEPL